MIGQSLMAFVRFAAWIWIYRTVISRCEHIKMLFFAPGWFCAKCKCKLRVGATSSGVLLVTCVTCFVAAMCCGAKSGWYTLLQPEWLLYLIVYGANIAMSAMTIQLNQNKTVSFVLMLVSSILSAIQSNILDKYFQPKLQGVGNGAPGA
jgi:hypothetical protein